MCESHNARMMETTMGDVLVRDLDDWAIETIQIRAERHSYRGCPALPLRAGPRYNKVPGLQGNLPPP